MKNRYISQIVFSALIGLSLTFCFEPSPLKATPNTPAENLGSSKFESKNATIDEVSHRSNTNNSTNLGNLLLRASGVPQGPLTSRKSKTNSE